MEEDHAGLRDLALAHPKLMMIQAAGRIVVAQVEVVMAVLVLEVEEAKVGEYHH